MSKTKNILYLENNDDYIHKQRSTNNHKWEYGQGDLRIIFTIYILYHDCHSNEQRKLYTGCSFL